MRLTAWEEERLLVFSAAELARRHLAAGLPLNAPEAIAMICDAMFEAARAGGSYDDVLRAGASALSAADCLPGVAGIVDSVTLEVLMDDGVRLVVLQDPLGGADAPDAPGAIRPASEAATRADARERRTLAVTSVSTRVIRVSSHHPFDQVNARLEFDRAAAAGFRLDLPAGSTERWAPGETRVVTLVRFGGGAGR